MRLAATRWSRLASPLVLAVALAVPAVAAPGAAAAAGGKPGQTGVAAAAAGKGTVAASASGGTLRGWVLGIDGQLGNGHQTNVQPTPVRVRLGQGVRVTSLRAGCDHALALTSNGHLLAWGLNTEGQLGNGSRTSTDTPVRVKLPKGTKIKAIRAGCDHSLALTTKGHVLAWGDDNAGQLGIGSHSVETRPVRVRFPGSAKMKIIAAGCLHSLAYSTSDQLYGWGANDWGQIGDGSTTERDTPVTVSLNGPVKTSPLTRNAATPQGGVTVRRH